MAGVIGTMRTGLVDNDINPATTMNALVELDADFIGVGGTETVIDAALANETDPYAYFTTGSTAADGVWLVTHEAVVAATQLPTVQTGAGGLNGVVKMTTDATSGEHISMQLNGAAFKCAVGVPLIMRTRCKFSAVTCDAFIGMAVTGATDPHASRPAGFFAFTITAASGALEFATGDAGSATASAALTTATVIVADTYIELTSYWDGVDTVDYYVNGVLKASATLTLPTGLVLSPVVCIESNGAAEAFSIDRVYCATARQ